jgi:Tol biopolymer transport system component
MQADGTNARIVADSLNLQGSLAWAPDGQSITAAADDHGVPHLFRVPLDGRPPTVFVREYSVDPAWAPDGSFVVYSGPDIGTTFSVKAVTAESEAHSLRTPTLSETRYCTNNVDWSPPTLRGVPKQRSDGCGHYSHLNDVSARALA